MNNTSRRRYLAYCVKNGLQATLEGLRNWSKYCK